MVLSNVSGSGLCELENGAWPEGGVGQDAIGFAGAGGVEFGKVAAALWPVSLAENAFDSTGFGTSVFSTVRGDDSGAVVGAGALWKESNVSRIA